MKANYTTTEKKLATAADLAQRYNVCRRSITNWIRQGKLHKIALGRRTLRFDVERADKEIAKFTVDAVTKE